MPSEACYHSNSTPDGNHSFGPPEVIVKYPDAEPPCEDLYEYVEIALNENTHRIEELLQPICQEGYPEVERVERNDVGEFIVSAEEIVYSGCRDIDFRSDFNVQLSCRFDKDGIHFFLSENAVLSFQHWCGDEPEED